MQNLRGLCPSATQGVFRACPQNSQWELAMQPAQKMYAPKNPIYTPVYTNRRNIDTYSLKYIQYT